MRQSNNQSFVGVAKYFKFMLVCGLLLPGVSAAAELETARDLLNQEQYEEAAVEANRYLSEHPGDTQARFIRGLALARAGRVDAAIAMFNELAEEYPDLAEPRNNLGVLYAQQGKFEQARVSLERAVEVNPNHGPAQENLGDVYVALARDAFEKASGLEQRNVAVREKRARLQALLDAPRGEEYVEAPPIRSAQNAAPEAIARKAPRAQAPREAAQPPASSGNATDQLVRAANTWAKGWSDQNVSVYLNAYSGDFAPESGQSRSAWARERSQRVSAPNRIEVGLSDFNVDVLDNQRYLVSFLQRYRSDNYRDQERKALLMRQEGASWKILREGTPSAVSSYARNGERAANPPETLAPVSAASPVSGENPEITALVNSWAQAWSAQDLDGYFAAYSNNFDPEGRQSLSAWIRERQDRISSPNSIRVSIDDLRVETTGQDTAEARFYQRYQSGSYNDRTSKTLRLQREANGWHIVREISN